jgi:hypothetical protein
MTWAAAGAARLDLHKFLRLQTRVSRCCELAVERWRLSEEKPSEECCELTVDLFRRTEDLAQKCRKVRAAELPKCCQAALTGYRWWEGLEASGGVRLSERSRMELVTILYRTNRRPITPKDVAQWSRAISRLSSVGRQDLIEAAEADRRMIIEHRSPNDDQLPWIDGDGATLGDLNGFIQVTAAIYKGCGGNVSRLARNGLDAQEVRAPSFAAFLARLRPLLPPDMARLQTASLLRHVREVLEGRHVWRWSDESQSFKLTRRLPSKRMKSRKKVLCPRS